jgi:hypothetical protein
VKTVWKVLFGICLGVLGGILAFNPMAYAQTQKPSFPVTTFTPPPSNIFPAGLVSGDFNGDGVPDVLYPTYGNSSDQSVTGVTVVLGQSSSIASSIVSTGGLNCPVPIYPMQAVDMNNDKKLDLLFDCGGYVTVMLGKGDGSFEAPTFVAVGGLRLSGPIAQPVDLNGDGYLDVVALVLDSNGHPSADVLLNNGSNGAGTLATPKNYSFPSAVQIASLFCGDFNGDGKQDVLVVSQEVQADQSYKTGFYLLAGSGDGTLQAALTLAANAPPLDGGLVTADFNNDGITDVAYISFDLSSSTRATTLQVLLSNSGGQFTLAKNLPVIDWLDLNVGAGLTLAGSTNGGKNVDLVLVSKGTTILLGDGMGGFSVGASYALNGSIYPEVADDGATNLLFFNSGNSLTTLVTGNGDGTFNAIPTLPDGSTVTADFNGDGLTDVLYLSGSSGNLAVALSRGNGTFSVINPGTISNGATLFVPGDFNGDGKVDTVGIYPGGLDSGPGGDAELYFFQGNGNGTFQPPGPAFDLSRPANFYGAVSYGAVSADFNGDGKLDIVYGHWDPLNTLQGGLAFVPGNGDGTFGTPVTISSSSPSPGTTMFMADLNMDGKPDVIWGGAIYLGKGDGTFNQQPLNVPVAANNGSVLAVGDLNGDGVPDIVVSSNTQTDKSINIYAGNGDGTFQTMPFYTTSQSVLASTVLIGDVNGDGHPDLVLENIKDNVTSILLLLGDGKGNFVADSNSYYAGYNLPNSTFPAALGRFNNQAPALPNDHALDLLMLSSGGSTVLLNQTNPTPSVPSPLPSTTTLAVSASNANPGQQLTFTATVVGANPSGTVTLSSGGKVLGTATVSGGVATLETSFAIGGTYSVTASYAGDAQNQASVSSAISILVVVPDFSVTPSPATATITAGQSATTVLTITPVGGYSGTINFSCNSLPSKATCTFSPASVSPGGKVVTSMLTISTSAPATSMIRKTAGPLEGFALAGLLGLTLWPKRIWKSHRRWIRLSMMLLLVGGGLIGLSGCNSSAHTTVPGTPAGPQNITVSVADSAGGPTHSISFTLTVE